MTGPGSKTAAAPVRRKPSREEMGRLPRLDTSGSGVRGKGTGTGSPTNKTTTTASPSTTSPAATTTTSKPKPNRRPEHHHQHTRTPSSPTKWKTKPLPSIPTPPASVRTVSSTPDDPAAAAPPTPDSAAGGMARMETLLLGTKALGVRAKWSSPDLSTSTTTRLSSGSSSSSASEANRPPAAAPIGPPKYTRPELIWLHRNYRGELPFLRAWGLDIGSAEDRAEGLEMLRELMLEEEENGGGRGGHERSGSKGSLAGSATSCTGEIEVGFQHHHQHGEVGL
ncbi:hypothetical protein QBC39DRAFT_364303 [Podospora conica]|nr:hypothetical protein QBC39DRAFT_364303 [Schizothecium conicum]